MTRSLRLSFFLAVFGAASPVIAQDTPAPVVVPAAAAEAAKPADAPAAADPAPAPVVAEPAPAAAAAVDPATAAPADAPVVKRVKKAKAVAKAAPAAPTIANPWAAYPTFDADSLNRLNALARAYAEIARNGGFPVVAATSDLGPGSSGDLVIALRKRLIAERDLAAGSDGVSTWDAELTAAMQRFQLRYGLAPTGILNARSRSAMAVSVKQRLLQIGRNMERLGARFVDFSARNVVVNIPNAQVEAIENGRVVRRYTAIVGRPENPSPEVDARIGAVNINPTWTVPPSIIVKELAPKMLRDPSTLAKMRIRVLSGSGKEIDVSQINWAGAEVKNLLLRQDSGAGNSLGQLRISMPNTEAVYMHDTPSKKLFSAGDRFFSHGCVRVQDVNDLAAWLLGPGWDGKRIAEEIAAGDKKDLPLPDVVPVHWVYMTAFVTPDGTVHFRDDVYGFDGDNAGASVLAIAQ